MDLHSVPNAALAQPTPPRLRIAVGIKRGSGPLVIEPPMTAADRAAHAAASYVRRPAPSAA